MFEVIEILEEKKKHAYITGSESIIKFKCVSPS